MNLLILSSWYTLRSCVLGRMSSQDDLDDDTASIATSGKYCFHINVTSFLRQFFEHEDQVFRGGR